jgi:hypothetical protein
MSHVDVRETGRDVCVWGVATGGCRDESLRCHSMIVGAYRVYTAEYSLPRLRA